MIGRDPPNVSKNAGVGVGKTALRDLGRLARVLGALPRSAKRRSVHLREPASGESRITIP
jgi:hypothetical protein